MRSGALFPSLAFAVLLTGCPENGETGPPPTEPTFGVVHADLPGALLSVWGTSENDVWAVGGDALDGSGPMVLHYDGSTWERMMTGQTQVDLWWVFGFSGGPVYMGGKGGVILRYESGTFTPMSTPDAGTVFGIWGATPDDVWAVGGTLDKNGFAWRLSGDTWTPEPSLPADTVVDAAIWKLFGKSGTDAWLVGSNGVSFHWDGAALTQADTGVGSSLFTVHANDQRYIAVGGFPSGFIIENEGEGWTLAAESPFGGLNGVCSRSDDTAYAVGQYGIVYTRNEGAWSEVRHGLGINGDFHAVWVDPTGGAWAVGGCVACDPPSQGVLIYQGDKVVEGGI